MENTRRSFIRKLAVSGAVLAGNSNFFKGFATELTGKYHDRSSASNGRVPICFMVDDSCPLVHVYWFHVRPVNGKGPLTRDGRPLLKEVPNSFLDRYCDVVSKHNIAGKISIVPSPGGFGDIVNGIPGYDNSLIREWLNTAKKRLSDRFDFSPEMLTHNKALNLKNGTWSVENESDWSKKQDRTVLTPYITYCLQLLKDAGIDANGVTSPWSFGRGVEDEYTEAIITAQKVVYKRELSWYFLHALDREPGKKPWIALKKDNCTLVHIASNMPDHFWETIDTPENNTDYVMSVADKYITKDGKEGSIINVLKASGWPIFVTHWQSLYSNGLETGLRALDEVGKRITTHLKDKVEWKNCMELTKMTVK